MKNRGLRIAVTMRESNAQGYAEERDSLARSWITFLDTVLPEAAWLALPNIGERRVDRFCEQWGINGLILTGGEDISVSAARDETERTLLHLALERDWPVFGVCRGLQLIWHEFGGDLGPVEGHIARRHKVRIDGSRIGNEFEVNSYHGKGPLLSSGLMAEPNRVFAYAMDGTIEGVKFRGGQVLGIMWHPEREPKPAPIDAFLVRKLFLLEQ